MIINVYALIDDYWCVCVDLMIIDVDALVIIDMYALVGDLICMRWLIIIGVYALVDDY